MAIRVLFMLLALAIITNIIIIICSFLFNVNLYEKHGKTIAKGFGIFIILIVVIYTTLAILGLA